MKIVQSSFFRAICSIIIGVLLLRYTDQTVTWITLAIGVMFLLSGDLLHAGLSQCPQEHFRIQHNRCRGTHNITWTPHLPIGGNRQHHPRCDARHLALGLCQDTHVYHGRHTYPRSLEPVHVALHSPSLGQYVMGLLGGSVAHPALGHVRHVPAYGGCRTADDHHRMVLYAVWSE